MGHEPFVHNGLRTVIKRLREQRGWEVKESAAKGGGGISHTIWSNVESGKTRPSKHHSHTILKAFGMSELEMWELKVLEEIEHYHQQAIASGDPGPPLSISPFSVYAERLNRLDADKMPPAKRDSFSSLRSAAISTAALLYRLIEQTNWTYEKGLAEQAQAAAAETPEGDSAAAASSRSSPDRDP